MLLARDNFGCGSSREHAPWALEDYGIRAIIAPSYADIFYNNCFKNGILPIVLDAAVVDRLFRECEASEGYRLVVDLDKQTVTTPGGEVLKFDVDGGRKHRLLNGLDDIGLTLLAGRQDQGVRRSAQAGSAVAVCMIDFFIREGREGHEEKLSFAFLRVLRGKRVLRT